MALEVTFFSCKVTGEMVIAVKGHIVSVFRQYEELEEENETLLEHGAEAVMALTENVMPASPCPAVLFMVPQTPPSELVWGNCLAIVELVHLALFGLLVCELTQPFPHNKLRLPCSPHFPEPGSPQNSAHFHILFPFPRITCPQTCCSPSWNAFLPPEPSFSSHLGTRLCSALHTDKKHPG